jgi:hypothetical protein
MRITTQREGMDLLEYRAMSSLRDELTMVVYSYFITAAGNSICLQLGSSCQGNRYCMEKHRRYGPSITYKITPAQVPLLQPARWADVLGQPSSLWPHTSPSRIEQNVAVNIPQTISDVRRC